MKSRVVLMSAVLLLTAAPAMASNPYVAMAGGLSIFHDSDMKSPGYPTIEASYDRGIGLSVSIGSRFDSGRIEGEFGYRKADISKLSALGSSASITGVDATVKSYMINGYYDMHTDSAVTPFLGGGVGLMNYELNDNGYKNDSNSFGYQLIAGIGFTVNKTVSLDVSYRLQGASDFEKDGDTISYLNSSVFGGIRLNF